MNADRFARAAESAEELRVWAHGHTAGYELAAEIGRPVLTHLRDQLDAAEAELTRYRTEAAEWDAEYAEHVRKGTRGDTRSHLDVVRERAERSGHPDEYADQIAAAEASHARAWSGWQAATTSPITTTDTGRAA